MRMILAICLISALVLLPATAMAANTGGQGRPGTQGNAFVSGEQSDGTVNAAGQYQYCARYGQTDAGSIGNGKMLRIRSCTGDGDQARMMSRNQTRLRDGSCGNCPNQ